MYATKLKIDLCNFPAIWAVLSILLNTQSNELQLFKTLQQVVDDYYDRCPTEVMSRLEHKITDIMNAMYDSVTNDNFDSISDDTDRVSGEVDNDYDKEDSDNDQMTYDNDNDNDTATGEMKYDRNMTNELKDVGTKDTVPYKRDDNVVLLHCGCLSLNPFIEFRIRNNSSSSDVLNIQASISISPKFESK